MRRSVLVLLTAAGAAGAPVHAQVPALTCSPGAPEAVTYLPLPGSPFQALPTGDGCAIFVSLVPGGREGGEKGIAVLRFRNGGYALERVIHLEDPPLGMALTHDGQLLVVAADSAIVFLDVARVLAADRAPVAGRIKEGGAFQRIYANVSPDDHLLFVSNERTASITVVDLPKARRGGFGADAVIGAIPVGRAPIALTFSPDGRYLYTTSQIGPPRLGWPDVCPPEVANGRPHARGAVLVVDVARAGVAPDSAVVGLVSAGCNPVRLALSPDGGTAYVTARSSDLLLAFDTGRLLTDSAHVLRASVPVGRAPVGLAVVDGGRHIVVANSNRFAGGAEDRQSLAVIDVGALERGEGAVVGHIPAQGFPRELALLPGGRMLLVTNFFSRTLELVDLARALAADWKR